jgi:hypothetical protein
LEREYVRRLRLILYTELNAKNKRHEIGTLAILPQDIPSELLAAIKNKQKTCQKIRKMLIIHE